MLASYVEEIRIGLTRLGQTILELPNGITVNVHNASFTDYMLYYEDVYKRQVYNPKEKGLGVPFEMTLGVHSDAGFSKEDDLIGTLGIYTTDYNSGKPVSYTHLVPNR